MSEIRGGITVSDDRYLKKYVRWLAEAGVTVERLTTPAELDRCRLLVLGGGGDLAAASGAYGAKKTPDAELLRDPRPERDALELALLARARERRLPVLGICRGLEILNFFLGGTLWADLAQGGFETAHHTGGTGDRDVVSHEVELAGTTFEVTSHHHQGVRRLAPGLEVLARAPDGLTEAVLHRELDWLAVLWHPERTLDGAGRALPREWVRGRLA